MRTETKRSLRLALIAVPALALGGSCLVPWLLSAREPSTRPAVVPLSAASGRVAAEGRVVAYPGAEVVVGTDFAGTLERVLVEEKAVVRKGALLAELDASEERAALAQARARITEAEADVRLAEAEAVRARGLLAAAVGSRQAVDRAERDRDAAAARRATAAAESERLAALIAKSRIVAPIGGTVLARHAERGETVARGARLFTLADLGRLRVEAEVDEADSGRVRVGTRVAIRAEGDPGRVYAGHVEEVPDSVTGRRIKPEDPGKPSDTRVLLAKIAFDSRTPLKLGRRVELEIETAP